MQCIKPKCHWERRERELCFGRISIHSLPWAPWTMQIEVSRIPEDSTKLISSIGTDPSWPDWHLQWVGDGSQSSEPDLDGSSGGFRPKKPDLPNPPNKTSKRRRKSGDVWASQLLFGHVWPSVTEIRSNPHSNMLKSDESSRDLLKLNQTLVSSTLTRLNLVRFQPNLGQISIDTMEYWPNLVRSSQISAKIWRNHKTRNRPIITRNPIRPNPVDLKLSMGWLRVEIFPTREGRVESRLGTNLTRPDPTRGHP